jgi:outer membrane protein assembly factor BamB
MRIGLALAPLLIAAVAGAGVPGWVLERRLVACCDGTSRTFAASLAAGPWGVLVGVPGQGAGLAVLFDDATGGVVARLEPPVASREFGRAVAVADDLLAVGAPDAASVFLFDARSGAVVQTLRDPHTREDGEIGEFGRAIALGPNDVVVGAPFDDRDGRDVGTAWVFDRRRGLVRFRLVPPVRRPGARFGTSVAIAGDEVLVGAPGDGAGTGGSVTVYSLRTGRVRWERTAPPSAAGRFYGFAVAVGPRHIAVGAPCRDGTDAAGLAIVYDRATSAPVAELTAPSPESCDGFGSAVAVGARAVVVGARLAGTDDTGAVHVFAPAGGRALASFGGGDPGADVGWSVATRGARVLAGAAGSDGEVRVYRRARD